MDIKTRAHIRNKLQATKSTLEKILKDEVPPKEFIKLALADLDDVINLFKSN